MRRGSNRSKTPPPSAIACLLAMERAETESDKARRDAFLTFVVIGGGPTGVEMAGAIAELARQSVSKEFRSITPHCSRIVLIEAGSRILASFPPALSKRAEVINPRAWRRSSDRRPGRRGFPEQRSGLATKQSPPARLSGPLVSKPPPPPNGWAWNQTAPEGFPSMPDCIRQAKSVSSPLAILRHATVPMDALLPGVAPVAKQQGEHCARGHRRHSLGA